MARTLGSPSDATAPSGRRRAVSRHRRSRRLPRGRQGMLEIALPTVLLAAIGALAAAGWAYAPEHSGPLPAAGTLLLVLAALVLLFLVARRAGLTLLGATVATALCAVTPPTVQASTLGVPEHLAVPALLGALLLLLGRSRLRVLVPAAALLAGLAAAVAPLAVAAAPFLAWQALRALPGRHRVPTLPLAGAVYFAAIGIGWALLGLDTAAPPEVGTQLLLDWLRSNPIGAAVAVAALVWGVLTPVLRPLTAFAATLLALSVWPDGQESARYTVLLTPALALLMGAIADRAVATLRRRRRHLRPLPRLVALAGAAAVSAALLGGVLGSVLDLRATRGAHAGGTPPVAASSPTASPATTPTPATPDPGASGRASAGIELGRNPRLTLEPTARRLLQDGSVDRRIAVVLGQLLSGHDLTVADFPRAPGEDAPVRRAVLVRAMDGERLRAGGASMTVLASYLAALTDAFAVESVSVTDAGVLATFPLPTAD